MDTAEKRWSHRESNAHERTGIIIALAAPRTRNRRPTAVHRFRDKSAVLQARPSPVRDRRSQRRQDGPVAADAAPAGGVRPAGQFHDRARLAKNRLFSGRFLEAGPEFRRFSVSVDAIIGEGCVIIKREGLRSSPPEDMEAPYAAKDEFESLQESMYESTASTPRGGALRASRDVGFRGVLDEIHKAHET